MKNKWIALAGLAIIGLYGLNMGPSKGDNLAAKHPDRMRDTVAQETAAAEWIVDQLDLDARRNPARRTRALNECIGGNLGKDGKIRRQAARRCYEHLVTQ